MAEKRWWERLCATWFKAGAYERAVQEKKAHNFTLALPEHLAEQAGEMMKSRYNLEFLGIGQAVKERELEDRLQVCLPAEFKGRLPTANQLADALRAALPSPKWRVQ